MAEHKIVYLIVDRGDPELPAFWRVAGYAYVCRDGSLNLKLDIHPNLKFNIRDPKSNGEREETRVVSKPTNGNGNGNKTGSVVPAVAREQGKNPADDDIPF